MRITDYVDLFYPDMESRARAAARRKEIAASNTAFLKDLQLEGIGRVVSFGNPELFANLAGELSDDIKTVEYRLDCLEDFLNIPELSEKLIKTIDSLSAGSIEPESGRVSSFLELNEKMDALSVFLGTVGEINRLYSRIGQGIKSEAIKGLFGFFEKLPQDGNFLMIAENLAELRRTMNESVKSVRIGINFDSNMIPDSAGLIEVSKEKIYPKGNIIERMVFGADAAKDRFSGEEHLNSVTRHTPTDIDTALFKELSEYTREYVKRISDALKGYRQSLFPDLNVLLHQLDYYSGAADFIKSVRARGVPMCRPKLLEKEKRVMRLRGVYDLNFYRQLVSEDALANLTGKIVLNDIDFDSDARFYMVTGANNGGKTTFARAVGVCQALAQAGMYVPAESAEISLCDNIFTHFPRDEKIGIDTSRFTAEIKELKEIARNMTKYSTVILNESLQSTTPKECLKIAEIHLELFAAAGVRGDFVTHLTGLYDKLSELNGRDFPSKLGSLVSAAEEGSERRLYKMERRAPSGESLAFSIYRKFGATLADLRAV